MTHAYSSASHSTKATRHTVYTGDAPAQAHTVKTERHDYSAYFIEKKKRVKQNEELRIMSQMKKQNNPYPKTLIKQR